MRKMLKRTVVILAATALTLSLGSAWKSASGDDPNYNGQSHCIPSGVTCAECATGAGIIYCANPLPAGYTWADCQQGAGGCWSYVNWNCGAQSKCADNQFNGNNCIGPINICK